MLSLLLRRLSLIVVSEGCSLVIVCGFLISVASGDLGSRVQASVVFDAWAQEL